VDQAAEPPMVIESAAEAPSYVDAVSDRPPELTSPPRRPVEFGVGTFMMTGIGSGGVMGLAPFITDGLGKTVFLRLSIGIAESETNLPRTTWAAGRVDLCSGIPGNYPDGSGLRLDLCGGADVGVTHLASAEENGALAPAQTFPYVGLGPSADLRAELGARAALSLRGSLGLNVARDPFVDGTGTLVQPPPGSARIELDLSWKLE